ncbi:hypothetical protein PoB_001093900 [Plakobranchus ocellatus]|uniref:Uncharacterized protein n=1 Tax=Plakobranchus ocellatus TaxID=259542 RepID=A0AAV3YN54_9GAST|nr:hypothetical protein PoB_001093900 [Plakobranchus ocellatus]
MSSLDDADAEIVALEISDLAPDLRIFAQRPVYISIKSGRSEADVTPGLSNLGWDGDIVCSSRVVYENCVIVAIVRNTSDLRICKPALKKSSESSPLLSLLNRAVCYNYLGRSRDLLFMTFGV